MKIPNFENILFLDRCSERAGIKVAFNLDLEPYGFVHNNQYNLDMLVQGVRSQMTTKKIQSAYTEKKFQHNGLKGRILSPQTKPTEYLLFVHGGPGSHSHYFREFICQTSEYNNCGYGWVFYDQRGCGESTIVGGESLSHEINKMDLENIVSFCLEQGIVLKAVVGHSYGALLTVDSKDVLQKYKLPIVLVGHQLDPEIPRIRSALMDLEILSKTNPDRHAELMKRIESYEGPLWHLSKQIREQVTEVDRRKDYYWHDKDAREKYQRITSTIEIKENSETFKFIMRTLYPKGKELIRQTMEDAHQKWILVNGKYDYLMAGDDETQHPTKNYIVFDKSGHYPHFEQPGDFIDLLNTFLNR